MFRHIPYYYLAKTMNRFVCRWIGDSVSGGIIRARFGVMKTLAHIPMPVEFEIRGFPRGKSQAVAPGIVTMIRIISGQALPDDGEAYGKG